MASGFLFGKESLERRILLLVGLGMLVIFASLGVSSFLSVRESIERSLEERIILARVVASHLDHVLSQNFSRLQGIAFSKGVDLEDKNLEPEKAAVHTAYLHSIFSRGVFLLSRD